MNRIYQIILPDKNDEDPHPSLRLNNGDPIYPGMGFKAMFPSGWKDIRLEMRWESEGAYCWYIAYPEECHNFCPIGLFVKEEG